MDRISIRDFVDLHGRVEQLEQQVAYLLNQSSLRASNDADTHVSDPSNAYMQQQTVEHTRDLSGQPDTIYSIYHHRDEAEELIIPNWFYQEDDEFDIVFQLAHSELTPSIDDPDQPSTSMTDRHLQNALPNPNRIQYNLPRDANRVQFYLNPKGAIPHHEVYPNMKVGVTASGPNGAHTAKFLLTKSTTGRQLHAKVRSHFGIPDDQNLSLAFAQYDMIKPDDLAIWNHGIRYFPTFIAQVPENFEQGDLMEIQYLGKGPNVNGDPTRVHQGHAFAPKRPQ